MSARSKKSRQPDGEKTESATSVSTKRVATEERTHTLAAESTGFSGDVSQLGHKRSSSPLNITRSDEKDELAHLNDRLASYIDYVRKLEKDKDVLNRKLRTVSEEKMSKLDESRHTYEEEIASLRNLVDDIAKQKAACDIEAKKQKEYAADAKSKLNKRDLELRNLQKKIESLERDVSNYKQDYDRYHALKPEFDALEKQLDHMRNNLEAETILRTDLENKVAGLREEIDFQNKIFKTERQELVHKTVVLDEEFESRKVAEYESRLADELQLIRDQTNEELQEYKSQMEDAFQTKLDQIRMTSTNTSNETMKLREELLLVNKRSGDLAHDLAKKSGEVDFLTSRIADLERLLSQDRENYENQIGYQKQEVKRLQDELELRFHEFSDLMHTKIALDQEILMYRKMLEGEEIRLNIQSPGRGSPFNIPAKRRRCDLGHDNEAAVGYSPNLFSNISKARYSFKVTTSANSGIEFTSEQDGQGRWVKLINSSNEDIPLGNWMLKHQADGHDCNFKFHRTVTLKPGVTCTIWSSDTNATHNPPSDIVMKNQTFNSGGNITITLMNSGGDEQASCSVVRERIRSSVTPYSRAGVTKNASNKEDRCSLM